MASEKFVVIGLGRFGRTVATTLASNGAEVLAIDIIMDKVEAIKDEVSYAVQLDAQDLKALKSQNVEDYDVAVVAIASNFEAMIHATLNLLNMGVKRVISRAMNRTQRSILDKLGVHETVSPEIEIGVALSERLLQPGIKTFLKLADEYEIAEVTAPEKTWNKSLIDLELRQKYHINVIAIERVTHHSTDEEKTPHKELLGVTKPDTVILQDDLLIVLGKGKHIEKFIEINQ